MPKQTLPPISTAPRCRTRPSAGARRRARRAAYSAGLVALCVSLSVAAAEHSASDKAAAEVLFEEGRKLVLAGDYKKAAEKFEASQRLDAGVGTLLYLADAYEKAGRPASAWTTFREAAATARARGQNEREAMARGRAAALEPKLPHLTLSVADGANVPGLRVLRNKDEVKPEALGIPVPTDPGTYRIVVSAPGKKPWRAEVTLSTASGTEELTIPELEDAPSGANEGDGHPGSGAAGAPYAGKTQRILGLTTACLGVVGLGVGGVFLAQALTKDASADEHCDGGLCRDTVGVDLSKDAKRAADIAGVAFAAGGALALGGVVIFLLAPSDSASPAESAVRVTPILAPGAAGVTVGGRF
jgi:serine/threonine-protein kinase